MKLNKKQQIVAWIAILLIAVAILYTVILLLPGNTFLSSIKIFLFLYFLIFTIGILLIYLLKDKKK